MASIAGQTSGRIAGHALELLICAPRMRNGWPSTKRAYRPSFLTRRGISAARAEIEKFSARAARTILRSSDLGIEICPDSGMRKVYSNLGKSARERVRWI